VFDSLYPLLKVIHIVALVAWFAGLFYVFRLFVYHSMHRSEPKVAAVLQTMESKLFRIIMIPATVITLASGLALAFVIDVWSQPWLHLKLLGVVGLLGYQELARKTKNKFAANDFWLSEKQCRLLNEVPTVLLILIVVLVIFKPF
jgi:putative membrane protein